MKVKIKDEIFDSKREPIMIILSKEDKINIKNMAPNATRYCSFPNLKNKKDIEKWMDDI
jgi:hypothetical protein